MPGLYCEWGDMEKQKNPRCIIINEYYDFPFSNLGVYINIFKLNKMIYEVKRNEKLHFSDQN